MKKSILSLSAAVALGGLGLVSTASAIVVYDNTSAPIGAPNGTPPTAGTAMLQHPAGTGHILLVPYFSAQGSNATLINIVNTDAVNGKAVKVRFRGASNSDDLLDFTLLMSPGDVWSGSVSVGNDGVAKITHAGDETTCTLPRANSGYWNPEDSGGLSAPFNTLRLPNIGTPGQALLTREGYVEILNMADIWPDAAAGSVFTNIKHVANVAPCGATLDELASEEVLNNTDANKRYDIASPTCGLMGSWTILNQEQMGAYSGAQTAMIITAETMGPSGTVASAAGGIAFFPQVEDKYGTADPTTSGTNPNLWSVTADPLLVGGALAAVAVDATTQTFGSTHVLAPVTALWYDLPDLSTPMVIATYTTPQQQADALAATLVKGNVMNEWMSYNGAVPFNTDWVVSQPTRRYHVAVDYAGNRALWSDGADPTNSAKQSVPTYVGYADAVLNSTAYGPMVCMTYGITAVNREEGSNVKTQGPSFSPGQRVTTGTCGEVFTVQFGTTSVLAAVDTPTSVAGTVAPLGGAGWAQLTVTSPSAELAGGLPTLGYAAIQFNNGTTSKIYNMTFPHRWTGSSNYSD